MAATENQIYSQEGGASIKDLILKLQEWWNYLLSKWITIFIFVVLGGVLGFTFAYFKKAVYTATTTFVLEDEKGGGGLGNLAGLASMAGFDLGGTAGGIFQGDNILQLFKSRLMLEKTLLTEFDYQGEKQLLIDRYIEINRLRNKWKDRPELLKVKFSSKLTRMKDDSDDYRLRDSVLGVIVFDLNKNYLSIAKPDKKLGTIQVDVKSKDEIFAKIFNDELVKNVSEFYINTKTKKTIENVEILQHKTDSVRAVMNGAIYTAVQVSDATPNLNPTRQIQRVAPAQKAQYSAETNKIMLSELVKNLELSKIGLRKETPLIQVIDQPIFPLTNDKPSILKSIVYFASIFGLLCAITIIFIKSLKEAIQ